MIYKNKMYDIKMISKRSCATEAVPVLLVLNRLLKGVFTLT